MTEALNSSIFKSVRELDRQLTKDLQTRALNAGWPKSVVSQLRVKVSKNDVSVTWPSNIADIVDDLEYGTPDAQPKPVLRTFNSQHGKDIADSMAKDSLDFFFDSELFP